MATIAENLQTIKDSTDAIKQAIIDKGGTIEGDITTWASAINNIQGGGESSEVSQYVFQGTMSRGAMGVTVNGSFINPIDTSKYARCWIVAIGMVMGGIVYAMEDVSGTGPYTLAVDY